MLKKVFKMATALTCPRDGCGYKTEEVDAAIALEILKLHAEGHRIAPATTTNPVTQKIRRPSVESEITQEKWNYFTSRWNRYKGLANITDNVQSQKCQATVHRFTNGLGLLALLCNSTK